MHLKNKIKTITGTTTAEITAVLIVCSGLLLGLVVRSFDASKMLNASAYKESDVIFASLDSLAEAERSAFVGTDINSQPDSLLALADTIVKKKVVTFSHKPSKKADFQGIININTASKVQLMKLPGVGEKTAADIIAYRKNKAFYNIEEIKEVRNIGPAKFEKMKKNITVK